MGTLPGQGQQNNSCSPAFLPGWVEGVVDVPVQQIHSEKYLGLEKSCFLAEPFFPSGSFRGLVLGLELPQEGD